MSDNDDEEMVRMAFRVLDKVSENNNNNYNNNNDNKNNKN